MIKSMVVALAIIVGGIGWSCSSQPPNANSASVSVTYNGEFVGARHEGWNSIVEMDEYMQKPGKKFIIFGARWCGPCKFIRRLVRQMDFKYQIMWVDVDTEWGGILWQRLEKNTVPILVEIDKRGELVGIWTDARGIVMHLLLVE